MKSILKKVAGIAICAVLALGMIGCSAESEDNLALLGILNGSGSSHEHTFADEWTSDATHHWHAATCAHTNQVKDRTEHSFGEWSVVTHPSEAAEGLRKRTCSECQYVAEEVMPKLDHTHAKGTFHAAVAGTCKAKSKVAYYDCTKEGCEEKLDEEGNVLTTIEGDFGPHVLGTKHDAVLGTCKTKASLEYYECATESCTEKLDKDLNVLVLTEGALDPANHESEETTFETIGADNHKEMHKCCNAVITASAAHIWNSGVVTKDPSTTEEGVKTYTCTATGCGQTKTEAIAKLPEVPEGFVLIPAGNFQMGSNLGNDVNKPVHTVTISKAFYMYDHEVTQAEYEAVMGEGSNPSKFNTDAAEGEVQENRPVEKVNWYMAIVYCNKRSIEESLTPCYTISGKTDPSEWGAIPTSRNETWDAVECNWTANGYRLPTEAEWEYAARAGDNTVDALTWSGTNAETSLGDYAWCYLNAGSKTHEVKKTSEGANAFGVYDMSGNVSEWCWDWYPESGGYSADAVTDPRGATTGSSRVYRGGNYSGNSSNCAVSYRNRSYPSYQDIATGFRVCRTVN